MKKSFLLLLVSQVYGIACVGDFELGVEALYWNASSRAYGFAVQQGTSGTNGGLEKAIQASGSWGLGVVGRYTLPNSCLYIQGHWHYLSLFDRQKLSSPPPLFSLFGPSLNRGLNFIRVTARHKYRTASLELGHPICSTTCIQLYATAGVRYVRFRLNQEYLQDFVTPPTGTPNPSVLHNNTSFDLVGPELKIGAIYRPFACSSTFLKGLGFEGEFGPSILIGKERNFIEIPFSFFTNNQASVTSRTKNTALGFHFKINAYYYYSFCLFHLRGEIGYCYHYYVNGFNPSIGITVFGTPLPDQTSIGFGGPYAGLYVEF